MSRPLRILHVPVDLGGHPRALAAAQRELGHDARCVSLAFSPLGFNGDDPPPAPGTPGRLLRRELSRLRVFVRALAWADVVHCHFGQAISSVRAFPLTDSSRSGSLAERVVTTYSRLLWMRDLPLLRRLGKVVAMTLYGDDIRLIEHALERNPWTHLAIPEVAAVLASREGWKRRLAEHLDVNAQLIYATNPDLLTALPARARFLPYGHVDPRHLRVRPRAEGIDLRLAHMPTNRDVKGTSFFLQAVADLQAEGVPIRLQIVENVPNVAALEAIAKCDVLLDQLRVGWYGGVAVEAMAMGRPVVCYLNALDRGLAPPDFAADIPLIEANPANVVTILRAVATMPEAQLASLGERSRAFVERWHDPLTLAKVTVADYRHVAGRAGVAS
jgi:hypothetical protein